MSLFAKSDVIERWKYKVKEIDLLLADGTSVNIPSERFREISIEHDYITNLFPLIKIGITVSSETYYNIMKNKNDSKIFLRIDRNYESLSLSGEDSNRELGIALKIEDWEESLYRNWLNGTFEILMDDNTENLQNSRELEEAKDNYEVIKNDNSDNLDHIVNDVDLYLFGSLGKMTKTVSKVFSNVNVTDAVCWLMTEANLSNLIMQNPDNVTLYPTLFIPELSISKALAWVDAYYGFYKNGSLIYLDTDYSYILPFSKTRTAVIPNDNGKVNIIIPKSDSSDNVTAAGSLIRSSDSLNHYIICPFDSIKIDNASLSNDYINGTNATSVDSYTGEQTTAEANANTKTTSPVTQVNENTTENVFYAQTKAAIATALSTVVEITISDYDISVLKPNKLYSLIFEDTTYTDKYKGDYIITSAKHIFEKQGEELFLESKVVLRKMA